MNLHLSNMVTRLTFKYRSWAPLLVAMCVVLFCVQTDISQAVEVHINSEKHTSQKYQVAGQDFHIHEWVAPSKNELDVVTIVALLAAPSSYKLSVIDVQKHGPIASLLERVNCRDVIGMTNGGFYILENGLRKPMGLVRSEAKELNAFRRRKGGGFITWSAGNLQVIPIRDVKKAQATDEALQSTPILVKGGKNDMHRDDGIKFNRTAIARTDNGGVLLIGAFSPGGSAVTLFNFSDVIIEVGAVLGIKVVDALAMDGGPSSHLAVPALKKNFGHSGMNFLPNAICLSAS